MRTRKTKAECWDEFWDEIAAMDLENDRRQAQLGTTSNLTSEKRPGRTAMPATTVSRARR